MGQGLSVAVDGLSLCKADIKPWLFSKKKGSKSLDVDGGRSTSSGSSPALRHQVRRQARSTGGLLHGARLQPRARTPARRHEEGRLLTSSSHSCSKDAYRKTGASSDPSSPAPTCSLTHDGATVSKQGRVVKRTLDTGTLNTYQNYSSCPRFAHTRVPSLARLLEML